ncbi:MAG: YhfC family intramembrane metalloprotease [Treponema sp.]|nr:YhfC family intramembrane metalloprotease [Treponema sp.]
MPVPFGGIERLFAIGIHLALSVVVFYAVSCRSKWWLYPLAILLHAAVDAPVALMQTGVIHSVFLVESFVGASSVSLLLLAAFIHKNTRRTAVKE